MSCLKRPDYKVEREQFGKNIHYTVYKNGAFLGIYRIKPGTPGGSIQCTDDPELIKEWQFIYQDLVWGDLQREFGKFPWDEPNKEDSENVIDSKLTLPGLVSSAQEFIRGVALNTTDIVIDESKYADKTRKELIKEAARFEAMRYGYPDAKPLGKESRQVKTKRQKAHRSDVKKRVALALYLVDKERLSRRAAATRAGTTTETMNEYESLPEVLDILEEFQRQPQSAKQFQSIVVQLKAKRKSRIRDS